MGCNWALDQFGAPSNWGWEGDELEKRFVELLVPDLIWGVGVPGEEIYNATDAQFITWGKGGGGGHCTHHNARSPRA